MGVSLADQVAETGSDIETRMHVHRQGFAIDAQQILDTPIQLRPAVQHTLGETDADHRVGGGPVPIRVDQQAPEQRLVGTEQLRQRIE